MAAGGFEPPATLPGTDVSIPQTLYIPNLTDYAHADRQSAGLGAERLDAT